MLHRALPLVALAALAFPAAASAAAPGPALTTPARTLERSLTCNGKLSGLKHDPVLLVHGTFADSKVNWSWNYKKVLPRRGITACTVDLPNLSAGDIQVSTEYVVAAVRSMARRSGRKVALLGHSQGGLEIRWALKWWPDIRDHVSDAVLLVTPNHGALYPDNTCTSAGACAASLFQMRSTSAFLGALNAGGEAIGKVPYTAIVTTADKIFVAPPQGRLNGPAGQVTNVAIQDICPDHAPDHNGVVFDAVSFALAMDALSHPGPAKASRIDRSVCAQDTMPGVTRAQANAKLNAYMGKLVQLLGPTGPKAEGEPALASYAK